MTFVENGLIAIHSTKSPYRGKPAKYIWRGFNPRILKMQTLICLYFPFITFNIILNPEVA